MNVWSKLSFAVIIALYLGPLGIYSQEANSSSLLVCSGADNCETCVRDAACFWCQSKLLCKVYGVTKKETESKDCGEWKWKSCDDKHVAITVIISASVSVALIIVLLAFICIKRDLWNRMKQSRFCDRFNREGLFEQEERSKRKRKHRKTQSSKAQKFAEKYQLSDSESFLYSPP